MHEICYNIVENRAIKQKFEEAINMYTKESNEYQYKLMQDSMIAPFLDKNHPLYKISQVIGWVSLSEKLAQFYCPDNGRPTKPSRLKTGLLILKHLYQISDTDTIDTLKTNIYAQYLCNVSLEQISSKKILCSSSLTRFRAQIGKSGIKIIEDEVLNCLKRAKLLKGRKLVCDTTVVPSNIAYPTDISLLEKVRGKAVELLEKAKDFGAKQFRTYKRTAKKVYIRYQKIRHHTVRSRRKTQKQIRQFAQRNIGQLKETVEKIKNTIKEAADSAITLTDKTKKQFIEKTEKFLDTAAAILTQQKDVYKGLPVQERIVSVHQPCIRPMVRGKYPVEVEFGPKVLLNYKNGFLFLADIQFNNISDTQLLETAINEYKNIFGYLPAQLAADRGFWSKDNFKLATEDFKIPKVAIQNKGKSDYLKNKPFKERLRRLRCAIEAKISLAKRKYGLNRIRYSIPEGEEIWIRLGLMAMNLKAAVGYG